MLSSDFWEVEVITYPNKISNTNCVWLTKDFKSQMFTSILHHWQVHTAYFFLMGMVDDLTGNLHGKQLWIRDFYYQAYVQLFFLMQQHFNLVTLIISMHDGFSKQRAKFARQAMYLQQTYCLVYQKNKTKFIGNTLTCNCKNVHA